MRLKDRIAIVTGAGRGIGEAIAIQFAAQGAQVIALERDPEAAAALRQQLPGHQVDVLDVTDRAAVLRMVELAVARFGRIDVLVKIGRASCRERVLTDV